MRRMLLRGRITPTLIVLAVITVVLYFQGEYRAYSSHSHSEATQAATASTAYLYYTLKQSTGFVLARALKGSNEQPLSSPQPVAKFGNSFGMYNSDNVLSMQLSSDGRYLAIDGTSDHGEQVWIYDTQQMTLTLTPPNVFGNFLHWVSGSHSFLYRPMLPLGPSAPMDGGSWNPGLWVVDAATGTHENIDIRMSSAFLVDAAASPDGTHIIYSTTAGLGMGSDTWLMNRDGSNISHLFSDPGGAQSITALFVWSPDGKTIAYERIADSPTPFLPAGLWIMNGLGGQQRYLAQTDGGHGYVPVWSPDSRKIAFVQRTNITSRQADMQAQALQSAIAVVDVSTGRSWVVASANQTGVQLNLNPSWTADSASITFIAANPFNAVLGGMPRYWSASAIGPQMRPEVKPLTSPISHVMAIG